MLTQPAQAEPGGRELTEAEATECSTERLTCPGWVSALGCRNRRTHVHTSTLNACRFSTFYLMNLQ